MNEDQLKREIEEALSVEPSLHFAAQVRARIAKNRKPSFLWIRWGVAVAGFVFVAVMVARVLPKEKEEAVVQTPAKTAITIPEKETSVPPTPVRRAAQPQKPAAKAPEVLIDPREVAAFERFVKSISEDRIDIKKLIELQKAAAKPAPVEEIALMPIGDLEPIVIEPLTPGPGRIESE